MSRRKARMIFKQLKAGLKKPEELSEEERKLVMRWYRWVLMR